MDQTEEKGLSFEQERASPTLPQRTKGHCETGLLSDASDITTVEDEINATVGSERSGDRKLVASIHESPQKLKEFGENTKSFSKRIKKNVRSRFSQSRSSLSDGDTTSDWQNGSDSLNRGVTQEESESLSETSVEERWNLVCAKPNPKGRNSSPPMVAMLRETPEEDMESLDETIDITRLSNDEFSYFVTLFCYPLAMDPEALAYLCEVIGVSEHEIYQEDIVLTFSAPCAEGFKIPHNLGDFFYNPHTEEISTESSEGAEARRMASA